MYLTKHARQRAEEMGLSEIEVLAAVAVPEMEYPSTKDPAARVAVANGLAVPYNPDRGCVITVLWHRAEGRTTNEPSTEGAIP